MFRENTKGRKGKVSTDQGVQLFGESLDEVVSVCLLAGFHYLVLRGVSLGVADVLTDGAVEEDWGQGGGGSGRQREARDVD